MGIWIHFEQASLQQAGAFRVLAAVDCLRGGWLEASLACPPIMLLLAGLSLAERQRVRIACELAGAPSLLVLQQPWAAAGEQASCLPQLLAALQQAAQQLQMNVVVGGVGVTDAAWDMFDDVLLLDGQGRTAFAGSPLLVRALGLPEAILGRFLCLQLATCPCQTAASHEAHQALNSWVCNSRHARDCEHIACAGCCQ